jgi:hypothetical protein
VDRDQPAIPGGRTVLSFRLEMVKERHHGVGTEILQPKSDHLATSTPCGEAQKELDAVSVGQDGVGADVALSCEVVLEEAAEQGRQGGLGAHD